MKNITIVGRKYRILSEHENWLYMEDVETGGAYFASNDGAPPEDAPVAILMKKFEESKS